MEKRAKNTVDSGAIDTPNSVPVVQLLQQQEQRIKQLEKQLAWFKQQVFGQKSEQRDYTDTPFQQTIAELLGELPSAPEAKEDDKQTITYKRGKAKKNALEGSPDDSGLRFDESVPVVDIQLSTPELEGEQADDYEVISHKTSYRLAQNPASFVVLKYTRPVVKRKSNLKITTTPAPSNVLDKSFADVSFLAGMLIDKFTYHQPLYRQHQKLGNNGIQIARSTLTNLTHRAIALLKPIYEAQLEHILLSKILAIDETPCKAGRAKKGKMKQGYYWPIFGEGDEICFTFSASRGTQHLKDQLGDFDGTILSDGYKAYSCYAQAVTNCNQALCWVHARRYFIEAEASEPQAVAEAIALIACLYQIESDIKEQKLNAEEIRKHRETYSKPVVDRFFQWIHEQRQRLDLLPSDPLSAALLYAQNREDGLRAFLLEPNLPLDTNHVERALRCIPMGKKNWMFCWSEVGAEYVGIIQSLISTCKMHEVNPYDYLVDVLQRINEHPNKRIIELTPRLWKLKFANSPLRSDLYQRNYRAE